MTDYEISDLSSIRHYRTELPNIIFDLGLKANELALYCAIKKAAGDNGHCTKSTKTLCKEAGVGERNFGKLKEALSKKFKLIEKPLITIEKRNTNFGDPDTDLITIIDIWPENYTYFIGKNGGGAKLHPPGAKLRVGVGAKMQGGGAKLRVKEEPINKNPLNKTTTTNKSSLSFSEIALETKEMATLAFQHIQERKKTALDENWNIDLNTLEINIHTFGQEYVIDQLNYIFQRMNKYQKNKLRSDSKISIIEDTKVYFNKACKENYANSLKKII